MPEPWPTKPSDHPPLSVGSTATAPRRATAVVDRSGPAGGLPRPGEPAPPGSPVPKGWAIAVGALSVLLLLTVAALVWSRTGADSATPPTTRPRTTTRPDGRPNPTSPLTPGVPPSLLPDPTVPPAGPAPTDAEVQAVLGELVDFVQQQRGLTLTSRPPVRIVDNETFDRESREALDRHRAVWQERSTVMAVMSTVDVGTHAGAVFLMLEPLGQVARYDTASRTIVLRGQPITPYTREQLVVALVNALDDQRFGIDRPAYGDAPDEVKWAFDALVAGDATRIADAWDATLSPADREALERAEVAANGGADPAALGPAINELWAFPTDAGTRFAAALAAAGGGRLDAAFVDPPHTTAEVLHPERYLARAPVVPVPPPAVDGRVVRSGVFGELLTVATLADSPSPEAAARVAAGWAGDSYVRYENPEGRPCIRVAYRASSPEAFDQLRRSYETWAAQPAHEGAEVAVEGDTLLVNRCVAGRAGPSPL